MGKVFFMRDKKKPMIKGWVLVTDSSEDAGEEYQLQLQRAISHCQVQQN